MPKCPERLNLHSLQLGAMLVFSQHLKHRDSSSYNMKSGRLPSFNCLLMMQNPYPLPILKKSKIKQK
uniref:Uncharacterized protein n=1 Tax=Anguilla anguilla TaxID=7936 RepID=A0A0E9THH5_ANGAN